MLNLFVIPENWRRDFDFQDCDSLFRRVCEHLLSCCAFLRLDTIAHIKSTLGHSSPIWTHRAQAHQMLSSHDAKGSIQMDMCSLGVVDLDLSISLDAFGLRAFDHRKPLTRMLPGSTPCELWLMLPDSTMGSDGFHDIVIENLAATPAWRLSHVSPSDMTALRWPRAVFRTMNRHGPDMERLRLVPDISPTGRFATIPQFLPCL